LPLSALMAHLKNKSLRGVLFDWDGALVDSYEADSAAYLAMFREMGIPWGLVRPTNDDFGRARAMPLLAFRRGL